MNPPLNRSSRPSRPLATVLFSLLLSGLSRAAEGADAVSLSAPIPRGHAGRVDFAVDPGGAIWARGAGYKASFERGSATYIPYFGARSPRNFGVAFRLEGVEVDGGGVAFDRDVVPRRDGSALSFDRGALVERYLTAPDSIEQVFVFDRLPARGEVTLKIGVATELAGEPAEDGFVFRGEHGSVRYGLATAIDASGATCAAPTSLVEGGIEIVVPASFVARARFPLTIDPVISTFWVDDTDEDDFDPDVAYDVTTGNYLAVYEEIFSASDHDVVATLLSPTGTVITSGFVDSPLGDDWRHPRVANNDSANQFLVVASVESGVDGRLVTASTMALGSVIPITSLGHSPDVGGDPFTVATSYCVVYEQFINEVGYLVLSRTVEPDGTLGVVRTLHSSGPGSPNGTNLSISKSSNADQWTVVWEEAVSSLNHDIYGARLLWNGTISVPRFPVDTTSADDRNPDVSTEVDGGNRWLVVYDRDGSPNRNIVARLMDGSSSVASVDLNVLEDASPLGDQFSPSVDCDGDKFAIAYTEWMSFPSPDEDVFVSTLTPVGNQLHLSEGHRSLSSSSSVDEHAVSVAANEGSDGTPGRFIAVWGVDSGGTQLGDVEGGLYDVEDFTSFCNAGVAGVLPCPCSNPPSATGRGCDNSSATGGARLTQTGTASIGNDTVVFQTVDQRPSGLSIVWQGNTLLSAGTPFGQGIRCAGGSLKRLYTKIASAGSVTAPVSGDPSVSVRSAATGDPLASGSTRFHFVSYRDPNVLGGCASNLTFNASQTGAMTWRP